MKYEIAMKVRGKQRDAIGWTAQEGVFLKGRGGKQRQMPPARCHIHEAWKVYFRLKSL